MIIPYDPQDIAEAFRVQPNAEQRDASLEELIISGCFRFAAERAVQQLQSTKSTDHETIFSLYYSRLVCLQLLGLHHQAAQEVRALQDFQGAFYRDVLTGHHLAPWELRVLAIRLQALGFGDFRRGIMSYYDLGRECRIRIRKGPAEERDMWIERLHDLGIRVSNALIETGDIDNALARLESQQEPGTVESALKSALLCLRVGRVEAARGYITCAAQDQTSSLLLSPLCRMAEGDFDSASDDWKAAESELAADHPLRPMVSQNLAVCLVYCARVEEVSTVVNWNI